MLVSGPHSHTRSSHLVPIVFSTSIRRVLPVMGTPLTHLFGCVQFRAKSAVGERRSVCIFWQMPKRDSIHSASIVPTPIHCKLHGVNACGTLWPAIRPDSQPFCKTKPSLCALLRVVSRKMKSLLPRVANVGRQSASYDIRPSDCPECLSVLRETIRTDMH